MNGEFREMLDHMLGHLFPEGMASPLVHRSYDDDEEEQDTEPEAVPGAQLTEESSKRLLVQLRDRSVSVPAKVAALHTLLAGLRSARQLPRGLLSAGGVATLCDLALQQWPRGGDLAASQAEVDVVAAVRPPAAPARRGQGGTAAATTPQRTSRLPHHSIRRLAAASLAELGRWTPAVDAMVRAEFFARLPPVLYDLTTRYRYGQSYRRMYGCGRRTDQAQYILERLTTLCADAAAANVAVGRALAVPLLDALVRGYPRMDVKQAKVTSRLRLRPRPVDDYHPSGPGAFRPPLAWASSSDEEEDEEEDGEDESGGTDEEEVEAGPAVVEAEAWGRGWRGRRAVNSGRGAEVPQLEVADSAAPKGGGLRRGQGGGGGAGVLAGGGGPNGWDPLPTAFMRFVASVWYSLPSSDQQRYLETGILAALTAYPVDHSYLPLENMIMHNMKIMYNRLALTTFQPVRDADAALRERACKLRVRGNDAFRAGRLEEALQYYTSAVALDWDEPTHRNNRCFTLLKLGRLQEAQQEGVHSVVCEPRNSRSWSRLGAVFEALQHLQAAQLCYRQANQLLGPRGDEELGQKLREVEAQLQGSPAWRFETVPAQTFFDRDSKWRNWVARYLPRAQVRALELMEQIVPPGMSRGPPGMDGPTPSELAKNPQLTAALASEPYLVSTMLRPLWEMACAVEEAPRVPTDPMLRFNVSWSDMGLRDRHSGLPFYTISCMSADEGLQRGMSRLVLGKPRYPILRVAMCTAIARPLAGQPGRPASVLLAHRAVPYYDKLKAFFGPMGIELLCETEHEAVQSAANYNTEPSGFNHRDSYRDEVDEAELGRAPGAASNVPGRPGAPKPPAEEVKGMLETPSDDEAASDYFNMLACAAVEAEAARTGGGPAAAAAGSSQGEARAGSIARRGVMPSDTELREAVEQLMDVCDQQTTTVKHLMAALRHRFGVDVSAKKAIVRSAKESLSPKATNAAART